MGKARKNSNYQTPKREAERLAREREIMRKKRNKIIKTIVISSVSLLLVASMIVGIVGCSLGWFSPKPQEPTHIATLIFDEYDGIEGHATVEIELYGNAAPDTVANFIALAKEGYYDDTYFHRIIDGFVAQGGDGDGVIDGVSNDKPSIYGEFLENGFDNPIKHERGVISMARLPSDENSASTQFFIVLETSESNTETLDGKYAAFGRVIKGMNFFDIVCKGKNSNLLPESQRPRILKIEIETIAEYNKRTADLK